MSIKNVVSYLTCFHGADPRTKEFVWPDRLDFFDDAWSYVPRVPSGGSNPYMEAGDIAPLSESEIMAVCDKAPEREEEDNEKAD